MAFITTERGTIIETLLLEGHSTPWLIGDWVHLHLVVTAPGQRPVHCQPMQLQKPYYDELYHTLSESDFWEDVGAQALMHEQALAEHRADPSKWSHRAV
jgi:hypothetical protein